MENEELKIDEEKDLTNQENENFEIKNKTVFSKDGYIQMNKELAKKQYFLILILEIILIGVDVFLYIQKSWLFAGVLSAFVVSYPFVIKLSMNSQLNRTFKTYGSIFNNAVYEFTFYQDDIVTSFTSPNNSNTGSLKYTSVYNIIENNDFLFVFRAPNDCFIVEKKGFDNEEDCTKVRELLKSKGIKYINRIKN